MLFLPFARNAGHSVRNACVKDYTEWNQKSAVCRPPACSAAFWKEYGFRLRPLEQIPPFCYNGTEKQPYFITLKNGARESMDVFR